MQAAAALLEAECGASPTPQQALEAVLNADLKQVRSNAVQVCLLEQRPGAA